MATTDEKSTMNDNQKKDDDGGAAMGTTDEMPTVKENQKNDGGGSANDLLSQIQEKIETLLDRKKNLAVTLNTFEESLVRNIESDIISVKGLREFCDERYIKDHVNRKLVCIGKELDGIIKKKQKRQSEVTEKEKTMEQMNNKLIKTSEWLSIVSKNSEKIKKMVSQFGTLPDGEEHLPEGGAVSYSTSNKKNTKEKTLSDMKECVDLCIEESLLISPMIIASLKRSYDNLPSESMRFCLLSLAVFPENFIIKKRPLIYWWMAEGFITSGEGEKNFMEFINVGLIQPWYEVGNINHPSVNGCTVHPWIRRMLVSTALDAQLFQFYEMKNNNDGDDQENIIRWRRMCLYDNDDDSEGEDKKQAATGEDKKQAATGETKKINIKDFTTRFNRLKTRLKKQHSTLEFPSCYGDMHLLKKLFSEVNNSTKHGCDKYGNFITEFSTQMTQINEDMKQSSLEYLRNWMLRWVDYIEDWMIDDCNQYWMYNTEEIYNRSENKKSLKEQEQLFGHYDLMNKLVQCYKLEKLPSEMERISSIINVSRSYLEMKEEWFGKLQNLPLRTLHLGRWRDSFPIPHIEVENTFRFLDALFQEAKHLKYLSLRGISRVTELPPSISNCTSLQTLDLKACYNLEKLPSEIAKLYNLAHFDVSECYLLQNNNQWSSDLIHGLEFLHTLKGLKTDWIFGHIMSPCLTKLSIIVTDLGLNFELPELRVLTITWRIQEEKRDCGKIELPEKLRKLDLRCYPYKSWPMWLKEHTSLETLYISGGDIKGFPEELKMSKLRTLRLRYLKNFEKVKEDFTISRYRERFPSLEYFRFDNDVAN